MTERTARERFVDVPREHEHCWHLHRGPLMMVLRDGHVVQNCCKCQATRTVHGEHAHE